MEITRHKYGYMEGLILIKKQKYEYTLRKLKKYSSVYEFVRDQNPSNTELLEELSEELEKLSLEVQCDVKDCIPLSSHRSLCLRELTETAPYASGRALQPSQFDKKRDGKKAFNQLTSAFFHKKRVYNNHKPTWFGYCWIPTQVQIIGHSDLETINEGEELEEINKRLPITPDSLLRFATRRP